jgi:hypothetical protein
MALPAPERISPVNNFDGFDEMNEVGYAFS